MNRKKRWGKDGIHIIGADADTNMRELKDYDICIPADTLMYIELLLFRYCDVDLQYDTY